MFLSSLLDKNRGFVEAAIELHGVGAIPANSYVIDLDTLRANTAHLMAESRRRGLTVYAMSKQLGRCPAALEVMTDAGINGYVAVDMGCARPITGNGHNLGHLGHLVQVPFAQAAEAAKHRPDYWTVFSPNKAAEASAAAAEIGSMQDLLVRVYGPGDEFYPGHEGGVALDSLPAMIDHIDGLSHVRFAGLTTFPALLFDQESGSARATKNVDTLAKALELATAHLGSGHPPLQVNAPGTTSTAVLSKLEDIGATQVEPGHGLTGTTPLHAIRDLPEQPAVLYLTEVAHVHQGTPLCFGGGLYVDPVFPPYPTTAIVAHGPDEITTEPVPVDMPDPAGIDYYARLHPDRSRTIEERATVIFGFRIQAFVTRANVTAIAGVSSGKPRVAGTWDVNGNPCNWAGQA